MPVLMPSVVFRWFVPAQSGSGLVPANGYKVEFYSAGTTTPKQVYDGDDVPAAAPGNIMVLNDEGFVAIKLGPGLYKIIVTEPDGTPVYTQDNIPGAGSFSTGFVGQVIASNIPATNGLAQLDTTSNLFTYAAGYYVPGDGGEGMFYQVTSSQADDGGYCIASTFDPTKRWLRIPDESGKVRAAAFGAILTRTADITSAMQAADVYASAKGQTLLIEKGSIATMATLTFGALVEFTAGAVLTGNSSPVTNLIFNNTVTGSRDRHFFLMHAVTFCASQVNDSPEWFGVSTASGDNTAAITAWFATTRGIIILPPGTYAYSGFTTAALPAGISILYGTIGTVPPGIYKVPVVQTTTLRLDNGWELTDLDTGAQTGGDLTINGTLETIDNVIVGGNASVTGTASVNGAVTGASFTGDTGSADDFRAGGPMAFSNGSTDIVAGTFTKQIKANTLKNAGEWIDVYAAGTFTSNTSGAIEIKFGGTLIGTTSGIVSSGSGANNYEIHGRLFYITATTCKFTGQINLAGATPSANFMGDPVNTVACVFTSNQDLTFHRTLTGATTLNVFALQFKPASPQ